MFSLNPEISIGNILTSVSIVVALGTFLYNEVQKRHQIDRVYEAEIRNELGSVLREIAQMDAELRVLFLSIEPLYVTASEIALAGGENERDKASEKARDFLWREIANVRAEMERRVLATSAQSNGLAIAGTSLQSKYEAFIQLHGKIRLASFAALSEATQKAMNSVAGTAVHSAEIGNALRDVHYVVERSAIEKSEAATKELSSKIHEVVEKYEPTKQPELD
ncbi:hypothetical protein [Roseobacter sp. S98]|uniref:hypothetical protein n=1 Tax=Roseobacter algicola (ex Choi et al. 2025) (nom. illeg.) TaxID=3092138 RepID=UPI0035C68B55